MGLCMPDRRSHPRTKVLGFPAFPRKNHINNDDNERPMDTRRCFSLAQAMLGKAACNGDTQSVREALGRGADVNAALGTKRGAHDHVLGKHGIPRRNDAGIVLYDFLAKNQAPLKIDHFLKSPDERAG